MIRMNVEKKIDLSSWKRKEHFDFFSAVDIPQYTLSFEIDVTHFYKFVKENGISFMCAMVYAVTQAAINTEAFCYRIRGNEVVLHSELIPSFTYMDKGDELFKIVNFPIEGNITEYSKNAQKTAKEQNFYLPKSYDDENDNFLYLTSTPWISFTNYSSEMHIDKNDAIPRIAWGKFYDNGRGRLMMPISLKLNHRVVHGYDTAQFYNYLQGYINSLGNA